MTERDFEALALALNTSRAPFNVCEAVAETCAESNPRFDRDKFMLACGWDES